MAGTGSTRAADINVVPLIDIVLVLLIIFMVITPIMVKEMDLNIPDRSEEAIVPEDVPKNQVVLVMTKELVVYLNMEPVPTADLPQRLEAIYQGRATADRVLFFDAEDGTNYGETVKVLDIARGAGVKKIGLVTDRTNMAPPAAPAGTGVPAAPGSPG